MPYRDAEASALDHTHCRAICEEIGERLRQVLKPEPLEIPRRLLVLLDRLAELDDAPSIVPSVEETSFGQRFDSAMELRGQPIRRCAPPIANQLLPAIDLSR
jgi:hypothetical protein